MHVPAVETSPAEHASVVACAGVQLLSYVPLFVQVVAATPTFRHAKPRDRAAAEVELPGCV